MGTLNPDLLSKEMDDVLNKAIELRQKVWPSGGPT
jgi:hypothetical protein